MTVDGVWFLISWRVINCSVSALKKWGSRGWKKKRSSSLFLAITLSFLVSRSKDLWNWCPWDLHCWEDGATKQREHVVSQTFQRAKGGRGGCLFNTPTWRILELSAVTGLFLFTLCPVTIICCVKHSNASEFVNCMHKNMYFHKIFHDKGSRNTIISPMSSGRSKRFDRCNLLLQQTFIAEMHLMWLDNMRRINICIHLRNEDLNMETKTRQRNTQKHNASIIPVLWNSDSPYHNPREGKKHQYLHGEDTFLWISKEF